MIYYIMEINDDMEKIYISGLVFYKINGSWWRVLEKEESFNKRSREFTCIVPEIKQYIEGGVDEIKKIYLRLEKIKRLDENS